MGEMESRKVEVAAGRTRVTALWIVCLGVAALGACSSQGESETKCAGYLGCSADQSIVEPPPPPPILAVPPLPPAGQGCGKPLPANHVVTDPGLPTGYMHYTVMGTGASLAGPQPAKVGPRTFWVRVPADYDPNHHYQVVHLGQGCGGYEVANLSTYRLFDEATGGNEEAIYVALDIPRDMANMDCYDDDADTRASQEWEAFALIHSLVDQTYCVDNDRVDVVGYDYGGALANMWGCYFAGDGAMPASDPTKPRLFAPAYHIRAQGSVAGFEPDNPLCNGPVAAIFIHDIIDSTAYNLEEQARDRALRMNGCMGSPTAPWHPELIGPGHEAADACLKYTACPAATPVVFCTTMGQGHADQPELAVPAFTLFFKELAPSPDAGATD
jgi:poly(3-hydroxybutyrate) depolymerase